MKKINQRNYFVVIDDSEEMWTAVKFAVKRAKLTKSNLTTISFIENISNGMLLTSSTEKILDKEQITNEKTKHKEVHEFIYEKAKINHSLWGIVCPICNLFYNRIRCLLC